MARPKKIQEESEVSEPELASVDSPVEPSACEDCALEPGQYIREANGIKYLAYMDKNGVTFDLRRL